MSADLACAISSYVNFSQTSFADINYSLPSVQDGLAWLGSNSIVNVLDYGANVNNGIQDATAAINSAIAAALPGQSIYFPAGTYRVNTTVVINKSNLRFLGSDLGSSIIQPSSLFADYQPLFVTDANGQAGT